MTLDPHGAVWTVLVGFSSTRPIHPDEHTTTVLVEASSEREAVETAAQMVGTQVGSWMGRPHPEMVTSARVVGALV